MKRILSGPLCLLIALCLASWSAVAQKSAPAPTAPTVASASSIVPRLVNYSDVLADTNGKRLSSVAGVTFLLYKDQQGGAPLWLETQTVSPDKAGHYTVTLGSTSAAGLPSDIFANGEARWLAVQVAEQAEQPRVLLVAVPYAMKAKDAETIGGLPPSAFVLAAPAGKTGSVARSVTGSAASHSSRAGSPPPPGATAVTTTTGGTANTIPLFTTSNNIENSLLTQTGNTAVNVVGTLNLPALRFASSFRPAPSRPEAFVAASYSSVSHTGVGQTFQLQAEGTNNNTAAPSATLNLLFGSGGKTPAETGFSISSTGTVNTNSVLAVGAAGSAIYATSSNPSATVVYGLASATTGPAWGVAGVTSSPSGYGVFGSGGTGVYGTGSTGVYGSGFDGVQGTTASLYGFATTGYSTAAGAIGAQGEAGVGVQSISGTGSVLFGNYGNGPGFSAGVWGDTVFNGHEGGVYGQMGVVGTGDDAYAGFFENDSNSLPTLQVMNVHGPNVPVFYAGGPTLGYGYCQVSADGNFTCTGTKSAVVPVDGGKRKVALYAIEGPENWFEDAGGGELVNGAAVVELEPVYAQTVNTELDYRVFLTPNGDCKGLYVTRKTATSFEVHELGGGTASIAFDYRIMAKRKGYETVRLAEYADPVLPAMVKRAGQKGTPQLLHRPRMPMPLPPPPPPTKSALLTPPGGALEK